MLRRNRIVVRLCDGAARDGDFGTIGLGHRMPDEDGYALMPNIRALPMPRGGVPSVALNGRHALRGSSSRGQGRIHDARVEGDRSG